MSKCIASFCSPENATVKAMCLQLLGEKLGPLKEMEAAGSLLPQVSRISGSVAVLQAQKEESCRMLLVSKLFATSETSGSVILPQSNINTATKELFPVGRNQ